jgi:hypothetical protein
VIIIIYVHGVAMKILSTDDLSRLNENDLKRHCLEVRSNIHKNKRMKVDTKNLEIYFCYIIRELESRSFVQHF